MKISSEIIENTEINGEKQKWVITRAIEKIKQSLFSSLNWVVFWWINFYVLNKDNQTSIYNSSKKKILSWRNISFKWNKKSQWIIICIFIVEDKKWDISDYRYIEVQNIAFKAPKWINYFSWKVNNSEILFFFDWEIMIVINWKWEKIWEIKLDTRFYGYSPYVKKIFSDTLNKELIEFWNSKDIFTTDWDSINKL